MKHIIFLLLIIILMPVSIKAKTNTYIKVGANISSFRTEEGKSEPGLCFGIGKEFYPFRKFNGFFGFGLDYQQKKFILENRTWRSDPNYDDSDIEKKQKPKEEFTSIDKVLSICTGVFLGAFVGGIIGGLIGDSQAYMGEYADIARGGLIGAGIVPFLLYESWAKNKGVRYPLNTWYAVAGSNTTFSNYEATNLRLGYSLGIGRNYHLSNRVYLQGEAIFNRRRLFFPLQRIRYETLGTDQLWRSDVDFSVAYVDIALLTKVRFFSFVKARLNIALGPAMSVQVLEKTDYNIRQRESVERGSDVMYDFVYISDEAGATSPFLGLVTAIELEVGKLLLKASLNRALHISNQIYPLQNKTKLHTLMFSLGYRFSRQ